MSLDRLLRAAELAALAGDNARMGRVLDVLGQEIAQRDPVTRSMLDLQADLRSLPPIREREPVLARRRA